MAVLDFDPQATVLSLRNARVLAQAAAVSYEDRPTCEQWARAQGFDEDFDFFSSTGVVQNRPWAIACGPSIVRAAYYERRRRARDVRPQPNQ